MNQITRRVAVRSPSAAAVIPALCPERTSRERIFNASGLTTLYRPAGLREFRMKIPLDPKQVRANEEKRLRVKEFDIDKLRPAPITPVGLEYD